MGFETGEWLKAGLGLLFSLFCFASALVSARRWQTWRAHPRARKLVSGTLAVGLVGAGVVYYRADASRAFVRTDGYDVFHYYLNAKYFDKLNYDRLYDCALAADDSAQKPLWGRLTQLRRLSDYHMVSAKTARADENKQRCRKELGGKAQWQRFYTDVRAIGRRVVPGEAARMFSDRGFNGTPYWTLLGGSIASTVSAAHIDWLTKIDVVLVVGALLMVAWAYGRIPALGVFLAFFLIWPSRWPLWGSAYLRYDWVSALIMSMCLLKKEKYALAGILAAWACGARIFPAALPAALGLKAVAHLYTHRHQPWAQRIPGRYYRFFGALVATLLVLSLAVTARWGTESFARFFENMKTHMASEHLSTQRVGLAMALVYDGETTPADLANGGGFNAKKMKVDQIKGAMLVAAVTLALLGVLALVKVRDDEAFAAGTFLFFVAEVASYYYYVILLCLILWHWSRIDEWRHRVGLGLVMLANAIVPWLDLHVRERYISMAWFSISLAAYFAWLAMAHFGPRMISGVRAIQPSRESRP